MEHSPVVVHPPSQGGRRVTVRGQDVGRALRPADVVEFLRRAGMNPDDVDLDDAGLIEWRGGGPEVWA
ncbi:hypothetical protein [Streptomyces sp. NPDC093261]|uniref:hypothetical protein n=1 Tax=Streptomyces sp. NPDC093261 TaxID=3366037 RepID=UPI0038210A9C